MLKRRDLIAGAAALLPTRVLAQQAAIYPNKPVRIIVPFAAGGRADAIARLLAQGLSTQLGQPFVVENRAGGSGSIGADFVAKAPGDGYTLLLASSGVQAILPVISKSLPYDSQRDFTPVALAVESFSFIGIHPDVPAKTLAEFSAYAKSNADKLNYASSGVGTYNHFAGEFFNVAAGTRITHIAYRGSGPSVNDLVAGHVQMMIGGEFLEVAKAGKVRILATTNESRWPGLPEIPTMREGGMPEFTAPPLWFGLIGGPNMPRDVVAKLNEAAAKVVVDPRAREQIEAQGSIAVAISPAEFTKRIEAERAAFAQVAAKTGMKFE